MSADESVLGKRERAGETASALVGDIPSNGDAMDDSDEDIGPMPMPEGAGEVTAARKKRKGICSNSLCSFVSYKSHS